MDDESGPVDLERLMDFAAGDQEQLIELVNIYLRQTAEQIENLMNAMAAGDATRLARIAHSCAGASATCGMRNIVPPLRELEAVATEGNLASGQNLVTRVQTEFAIIKEFFVNCPATAKAA